MGTENRKKFAEKSVMRRTRSLNPWGYQEVTQYQSEVETFSKAFEKLFASAKYDKSDKKIHFFNLKNEEKATIDVTEFPSSSSGGSGSSISALTFDDGNLSITCTDGEVFSTDISGVVSDVEEKVDALQGVVDQLSADTQSLSQAVGEVRESSFTNVTYELDQEENEFKLNFYNMDNQEKDSVSLFDTDSQGNILMKGGSF